MEKYILTSDKFLGETIEEYEDRRLEELRGNSFKARDYDVSEEELMRIPPKASFMDFYGKSIDY